MGSQPAPGGPAGSAVLQTQDVAATRGHCCPGSSRPQEPLALSGWKGHVPVSSAVSKRLSVPAGGSWGPRCQGVAGKAAPGPNQCP